MGPIGIVQECHFRVCLFRGFGGVVGIAWDGLESGKMW